MQSSPASSATNQGEDKLERRMATFLGWFSLGLGVPQLVTPGRVNRLIGVRDDSESRMWQRIVGVRELAAAAGILSQRRPTEFLWARVAGDVKDLALLANAFRNKPDSRGRLTLAAASVVGVTVADTYTSMRFSNEPDLTREEREMQVKTATTILASREEVFQRWRYYDSFIAAEADVHDERPNDQLAWRSHTNPGVDISGVARFVDAPGDRGTEVHLDMTYSVPTGRVGMTLAKLLGDDAATKAKDDLRRFKQLVEVGEVVRSEGSPEGPSAKRLLMQRPARHLDEKELAAVGAAPSTSGRSTA
jgi:hypothetical protein